MVYGNKHCHITGGGGGFISERILSSKIKKQVSIWIVLMGLGCMEAKILIGRKGNNSI